VLINGGGSYLRLNSGGIESGTNGAWIEYAASHSSIGPDNMPVPALEMPDVALRQTPPESQVAYSMQQIPGLSPMLFAGQPYTLLKNGAEIKQGRFDEYGRLAIDKAARGERYQVKLFNGTVHDVPVAQDRMEFDPGKADYNEQQMSNKGYRADGLNAQKRHSQKHRGDKA